MRRHTGADVIRKAELIHERLQAAGLPGFAVHNSNPDGTARRYEFAGWVYKGAGEACRALDAILYVMRDLALTESQRRYVARAIDVARSDEHAASLLTPTERDELLKRFGGREEPGA